MIDEEGIRETGAADVFGDAETRDAGTKAASEKGAAAPRPNRLRRLGMDFRAGIRTRITNLDQLEDPLVVEARRKARRVEDPGMSFFEIFRSSGSDGEKMTLRKISRLGAFHAQKAGDWIANRFRRRQEDVFDKADRLGDFWNGPRGDADLDDRPREKAGRTAERAGDGGRAERMNPTGTRVGRPWMRVKFVPDRPENRIGPDRSGPVKRLARDEDAGPRDPDRTTSTALRPAPRLLKGPDRGRDTGRKSGREVAAFPGQVPPDRRIAGPGKPGNGREAAQKGAERARRIAQERGRGQGASERSDRDTGIEI